MKCEVCGDNDASVELTQVVDGAIQKWHLCSPCAQEQGVQQQGQVSLTDILFGMGAGQTTPPVDITCPKCHMTRADFKQKTRFGCPYCYTAFERELEPLLVAMHRSDRHTGKIPRSAELSARIEALSSELDDAVRAQNFELAAELRDRIAGLKSPEELAGEGTHGTSDET